MPLCTFGARRHVSLAEVALVLGAWEELEMGDDDEMVER